MRKILYDKINKRECTRQYLFDQYGDCYINTNPFGIDISGKIQVTFISKEDVQYEVKETILLEKGLILLQPIKDEKKV
jgi:hypothetical protein